MRTRHMYFDKFVAYGKEGFVTCLIRLGHQIVEYCVPDPTWRRYDDDPDSRV